MTVQSFLETLGGRKAVSDALGVPITTIHTWAQNNAVPSWRLPDLAELAVKLGKPVPADFGPKRKRAA